MHFVFCIYICILRIQLPLPLYKFTTYLLTSNAHQQSNRTDVVWLCWELLLTFHCARSTMLLWCGWLLSQLSVLKNAKINKLGFTHYITQYLHSFVSNKLLPRVRYSCRNWWNYWSSTLTSSIREPISSLTATVVTANSVCTTDSWQGCSTRSKSFISATLIHIYINNQQRLSLTTDERHVNHIFTISSEFFY